MSITSTPEFRRGRLTEGLIAAWLIARGNMILPAYEIELSRGKGPQLFCQDAELVVPDMLVFTHKGIRWIEAKHKTVFTWYRIGERWTTGIDQRHYFDYMDVQSRTQLPVHVMFYHVSPRPSSADVRQGSPQQCPTGLFSASLKHLWRNESHRSSNWGSGGMVYWAAPTLKLIATCAEVEEVAARRRSNVVRLTPQGPSAPRGTH